MNHLDFEKPIQELHQKIEELRFMSTGSEVSLSEEIQRLESKSKTITQQIYSNLTPWQIAQVARHPQRPYSLDYVKAMFTDWEELHGDRMFRDDHAMVCGIARFDGRPIAVLGQQKGRDAKERVYRNFGMPKPEGYRKALRILKLAEKFNLPVITLIDTPGAYPGVGAEERNQSEAIARNLMELSRLRVPIISTVIGEGGSGGALAIGVCDHLMMLQHSIYSVISPEGCASILFKDAGRAPEAAEAMKLSAQDLLSHGLVDEIVPEPLGGAHCDPAAQIGLLQERLQTNLLKLMKEPVTRLLENRYQRMMQFGAHQVN